MHDNIQKSKVKNYHHHHQVPDLEQTLATMPLQTSLSSDNFKKFKPLLCPPVAELQRLSRNVIRCLPLSRLPSTLPVKDKNSKPLRLHTCPKNSICYALQKNYMLITLFKNNTWLIVLDLRQLLRWETSSPAFEKSLSEGSGVAGMRNK